ncbi:hypothetical protein DPMN_073768 [Dreissena polymorpha]|uniref:Uncharacterized protein n=1 Tax=Dreissena polymorpha TaxID=45954 RepID=A0A9D4HBL6_DREPO|nr:hypothetical protein DPMN_073768 [Dreissena polymorpha]
MVRLSVCRCSATDPLICLHMECRRKDQCTYIAAARGTPCDEPSLNKETGPRVMEYNPNNHKNLNNPNNPNNQMTQVN